MQPRTTPRYLPPVTEERFWQLVEQNIVLSAELEVDTARLQQALAALPAEEILEYDEVFTRLYCASYARSLWGAAYIINGGCSDDGFDYFRAWLIAQGRETFERALQDPDSLADRCTAEVECEEMLYVADRAYESATGRQMPRRPYRYPDLGDGWDFDDLAEMARRYPRLSARF